MCCFGMFCSLFKSGIFCKFQEDKNRWEKWLRGLDKEKKRREKQSKKKSRGAGEGQGRGQPDELEKGRHEEFKHRDNQINTIVTAAHWDCFFFFTSFKNEARVRGSRRNSMRVNSNMCDVWVRPVDKGTLDQTRTENETAIESQRTWSVNLRMKRNKDFLKVFKNMFWCPLVAEMWWN